MQNFNGVSVYYTDHEVNAVVNHTQNLLSCGDSEWKDLALSNIPNGLRPRMHQFSGLLDKRVRIRVNIDGVIQYQSNTSSTNAFVQCNFCWFI